MRIAKQTAIPLSEATQEPDRSPPARSRAQRRPSFMGYLVLGLAATGLAPSGINAARLRTGRTGRLSPTGASTGAVPAEAQPRLKERAEMRSMLNRYVDSFAKSPADTRPQRALPTVDDPRVCPHFD